MKHRIGPEQASDRRSQRARSLLVTVLATLLALGGCAAPDASGTLQEVRVATTSTAPSGWLHTDGGAVKDADGRTYVIKAANWFGLETSDCVPHGLWTLKMEDALAQIKSMGFNTIRLPYSNECITSGRVSTDTNFWANPDLKGKTPQQVMDIVIATSKTAGLNVILDRHRPSSAAQSELWYTPAVSEATWIADWKKLAERYRNEPTVIGADLHNEPHGAARWGGNDPARDWHAAATRAGNAIQTVNPRLLVIVEGVEAQNDGTSTWWGGGLKDVRTKPVRLTVPNQVVYSPHDYPASVFAQKWFAAPTYPANLAGVWDANWGYIAKEGIAPVLVGEFGTRLETTSDKQWMTEIVKYLRVNGTSFSYWSFNPNSSDTGGLVGTDWRTPQTAKLDALRPILDVPAPVPPAPAPTASATPPPTPSPTAPVAPKPSPTATTAPSAAPTPTPAPSPGPTVAPSPSPAVKPTPTPAPVPSVIPSPTPTPTPTPAPSSSKVTAAWALQGSWWGGHSVQLKVTATQAVAGWSVTYKDPNVTRIPNSWGARCSFVPRTSITCVGSDWTTSLKAGQVVSVGLQVDGVKPPTNPVVTATAR
ncbi:cellulase family glycosylhydrolase [Vibrio cholerae]|nr:cellulase family glycosylhydrolase [Vibrio cholerae]